MGPHNKLKLPEIGDVFVYENAGVVIELASQDLCERLAMMSAANLTLEEMREYTKLVRL